MYCWSVVCTWKMSQGVGRRMRVGLHTHTPTQVRDQAVGEPNACLRLLVFT